MATTISHACDVCGKMQTGYTPQPPPGWRSVAAGGGGQISSAMVCESNECMMKVGVALLKVIDDDARASANGQHFHPQHPMMQPSFIGIPMGMMPEISGAPQGRRPPPRAGGPVEVVPLRGGRSNKDDSEWEAPEPPKGPQPPNAG